MANALTSSAESSREMSANITSDGSAGHDSHPPPLVSSGCSHRRVHIRPPAPVARTYGTLKISSTRTSRIVQSRRRSCSRAIPSLSTSATWRPRCDPYQDGSRGTVVSICRDAGRGVPEVAHLEVSDDRLIRLGTGRAVRGAVGAPRDARGGHVSIGRHEQPSSLAPSIAPLSTDPRRTSEHQH